MGWQYYGPEAIAAADPVAVLRELGAACAERGISINAAGFMTWYRIRNLVWSLDYEIKRALPRFVNPAKLSTPDAAAWPWTLADFYAAEGIAQCATEGSFEPLLRVAWVWEMQRMLNAMRAFQLTLYSGDARYSGVDYYVIRQDPNMEVVRQAIRSGEMVAGEALMSFSGLSHYQSSSFYYGHFSLPSVRWLSAAHTIRLDWRGWLRTGFDFTGLGLATDSVSVLKTYSGAEVAGDMPAFDRSGMVFPPLSTSYSEVKAYAIAQADVPGGYQYINSEE